MTADNDVNSIFEKHSVKEIEIILSKMRNDIEKKKEDLRIMVGERYRDLIEAADTIAEMRESAECVRKNIETMEGLCESLQQRGLIGFKTRMGSTSTGNNRLQEKRNQYSLAIQVKLLVDVPEILWGLTEKKQFLSAAQLFLLSQQAHTALQLSPNATEMLDKFPVIVRQWGSISQFRSTIAKGCIHTIRNEVQDCELVLNAVCALMLLEGLGMSEALSRILQLRRSCLEGALESRSASVAKNQIVEFVVKLISTVKILHFIFIASKTDQNKCRLEKRIRSICADSSAESKGVVEPLEKPPISLLHESSPGLNFLPKSVVEFRPMLRSSVATINPPQVQEEVAKWLTSLVRAAEDAVANLLSCTTSMKALALIRSSIWEAQRQHAVPEEEWTKVVEEVFSEPNFSPWLAVVRSGSRARAQDIIEKELRSSKDMVLKLVTALAKDIVTNPKICSEEGNVSDFLWSESSSDLPDQSAWLNITERNTLGAGTKMGLFYKCRAFTKRVQNICKSLNSKLVFILEDLAHYSPDSVRDTSSHSEVTNNTGLEYECTIEDYNILLGFLEEKSLAVFKRFLKELESLAESHSLKKSSGDAEGMDSPVIPNPHTTVLVTLSRLCQALPIVCSQLPICAGATMLGNQETARRLQVGAQPDTKSWLEMVTCFRETSTSLMSGVLLYFTRFYTAKFKEEITGIIAGNVAENLLSLFPLWDSVRIEEESEGGAVVESRISVPAHPSPALFTALMGISSAVNSLGAHTVSKNSQMALVASLTSELTSIYETLASYDVINQMTAFQIVFDIKLIQSLLVPRENKEIGSKITSLIQSFESHVDPFDLDVFSPHLKAKVKAASQRLVVLLGTMIPRDKQPLGAKSVPSSSSNNSLYIIPAVEIPRFSNVPLPPSAYPKKGGFTLPSSFDSHIKSFHDSSDLTSTRDMTSSVVVTSSSKSTASSLFSAMSTSWFGGASS